MEEYIRRAVTLTITAGYGKDDPDFTRTVAAVLRLYANSLEDEGDEVGNSLTGSIEYADDTSIIPVTVEWVAKRAEMAETA